jgi:hypothetical protein
VIVEIRQIAGSLHGRSQVMSDLTKSHAGGPPADPLVPWRYRRDQARIQARAALDRELEQAEAARLAERATCAGALIEHNEREVRLLRQRLGALPSSDVTDEFDVADILAVYRASLARLALRYMGRP